MLIDLQHGITRKLRAGRRRRVLKIQAIKPADSPSKNPIDTPEHAE